MKGEDGVRKRVFGGGWRGGLRCRWREGGMLGRGLLVGGWKPVFLGMGFMGWW